ncbi:hypothetical protein PAXINDRAFT_170996 [Paxillus involutus ATCC 200175]|uniref:Uncharacterized protein n=1 Tax=Paxillus involutus ATCC 200175 TaxID=664439 RepID=A0A0C9TZS7_PAXIN|nr:hypothetical protein PAXINDRAFT_170996 [Paxillus involutus ATCC 200175]
MTRNEKLRYMYSTHERVSPPISDYTFECSCVSRSLPSCFLRVITSMRWCVSDVSILVRVDRLGENEPVEHQLTCEQWPESRYLCTITHLHFRKYHLNQITQYLTQLFLDSELGLLLVLVVVNSNVWWRILLEMVSG